MPLQVTENKHVKKKKLHEQSHCNSCANIKNDIIFYLLRNTNNIVINKVLIIEH